MEFDSIQNIDPFNKSLIKSMFDQTDLKTALNILNLNRDYIETELPYELSYGDLFHIIDAFYTIGLRNYDVLEFGGQLSYKFIAECIRPRSWCSITLDLYNSDYHYNDAILSREGISQTHSNAEFPYFCTNLGLELIWQVSGFFSSNPPFDRILSVAAFEHLRRPSFCLSQLSSLCRQETFLYSYFTPVWSAPNGHHWSYSPFEIKPFSHLYYSYNEMIDYFLSFNSPFHSISNAEKHAYFIYKSTRINRLLPLEWDKTFRDMPFKIIHVQPVQLKAISAFDYLTSHQIMKVQSVLKSEFSCSGYRLIATKE